MSNKTVDQLQMELIELMQTRMKQLETVIEKHGLSSKSKLNVEQSQQSMNLQGANENLERTRRFLDNEVYRKTGKHLKNKNYAEVYESLRAGDYKHIEQL